MTESAHSPSYRNFVHAGVFLVFGPPLGLLADPRNHVAWGRSFVVAFLLLVTLFNMLVLPRLPSGKRIARPGEGFVTGQWLYTLSLAICFWVFPPFAALGAWAAMAGGDAAASFAGRTFPKPKLPWNDKKSWAGFCGFLLIALPFCWFALLICPSQQFLTTTFRPELPYVWTLAVLAAFSGAILESLREPWDDNVRVPLGVALVLSLAAAALSWSTRDLPKGTHVQPEFLLHALAANAVLGGVVLAFRFADVAGTALGVAIGVLVYFFAGWQGYTLFLAFVAVGSVLSKVGLKKKQAIGAAEAREGKRGVSNVAANLAVPAFCCLAYPLNAGHPAFLLAYAGAIAAALADTASSEIGALSGRQPVLITTWKPAPHGTNGAVTPLGFVAAFAAAAGIAALTHFSGFLHLLFPGKADSKMSVTASCIIVGAGMAGTIVDSLLGATVEDRIPGVGKGTVNFACTLTGAAAAGGMAVALL